MEQWEQKIITKILSFTYGELENWIRSRLHGNDSYFSTYLGHETNLRGLLADAFHHINNERFRDNFIEILEKLISELKGYSTEKIDQNKEYIYELVTLCRRIETLGNKSTLFKIAKSGKLKPFKIHDTDLHLVLLTTLQTFKRGGNYKFWIEQMKDDSNKYYANAAFYALLKHGYRLDILFKYMGTFIDRFKGGIELAFGIEALFDYGEPEKIYEMFKKIESQLSLEQKEEVNNALIESGYDPAYRFDTAVKKELHYKPSTPQLQFIGEPTPQYEPTGNLQDRLAEIFKLMGFQVELNREIAGHTIDLLIKKKKSFSDKYECWIGICRQGKRKIGKDFVHEFYPNGQVIMEELKKHGFDDCRTVIVSEKGFTKEAIKAAEVYGIELKTLDRLLSDLKRFHFQQKKLVQDFEAIFRPGQV